MKKILSILLLLSLTLTLFLPAGASGAIDSQGSSQKEYDIAGHIQEQDIRTAKEGMKLASASDRTTRRNAEDNLVFPAPITEGCAYYIDMDHAQFTVILAFTGKSNQYFCVSLYAGDDLNKPPVFSDYGPFGTGSGLKTERVTWSFDSHYDNIPEGKYTLLTYTAEVSGNSLVGIPDTAFATEVYFYRRYIAPTQIFLQDLDTGNPVDSTLRLVMGESYIFTMGRSPIPSAGQEYINGECDLLTFESIGGLCSVVPEKYGTSTLKIKYGPDWTVNYNVEVCTLPGGHRMTETIAAGTPTKDYDGCTLQICENCFLVKRTYSPNLKQAFKQFTDIASNGWYYDFVKEAVYRKLFNGTTNTTFSPNNPMTRAMLVTVLWRYEGEPKAYSNSFSDVPAGAWYAEAVNWGAEQGIINGTGKGRFSPNGTITREQLTTILYRYAQKKAVDLSLEGDISAFPDGEQVNSWAVDAMAWALGKGLVSGVGKNDGVYLMPRGDATRAQVSAILIRFITSMMEVEEVRYPDTATAVDSGTESGTDGTSVWAFYETGLLQIGGTGSTPRPKLGQEFPWVGYKDQITRIEILDGIHTVVEGSFADYPNLTAVSMADTVTVIEDKAFENAPKLENLTLSRNLEKIGNRGFFGASSLKALDLPASVMELGLYAFEGCISLEQVSFPHNLRNIGRSCFRGCSSLKEAMIPESVLDNIGPKAFEDCTSLVNVYLPSGIVTLNAEVFSGCSALKEIYLPSSLEVIDVGAFGYCSSLKEIILPPHMRVLYYGTFIECTSLENMYIFSHILKLVMRGYHSEKFYNDRPFGESYVTTVWGCSNYVANMARNYGYTYKDLSELY